MRKTICLWIIVIFSLPALAVSAEPNPKIRMETSMGVLIVELYPDKAPLTVSNFLGYCRSGFYDNTIFHRVIKGFMIQGGGLTADMRKKTPGDPVRNEADNGLKNRRGTLAMARTQAPHSATAQFFINTVNNDFLDHRAKSSQGWGYCVFGKVVEGMSVLDAVSRVPTRSAGGRRDVPVEPVVILRTVVPEAENAVEKTQDETAPTPPGVAD